MKNVLIHIGYHKTGTTWLQKNTFSKNSTIFQSISPMEGDRSFAKDFIWDENGYLLNPFDLNEEDIRRHLKKLVDQRNDSNKIYVVSDERLSGSPHSSGFNSSVILKRIKKIFPNGKILIVIREQNSWLLSNYYQYLTAGGTHSLKKYLNINYDGKRPGFSPNHVLYHHLIRGYQDEFGKENVLVLPYELFRSDKIDFFKKFSDFLNIEIPIEQEGFENYSNKHSNYYLNYNLRFLNPFLKSSSVNDYSSHSNKVSRTIAKSIKRGMELIFHRKWDRIYQDKLKKEVQEWSANRFVESNKESARLINVDLEKYNYW
jgi:hypothetical protein